MRVVYTWASWIFLDSLGVFDLSLPWCPGPHTHMISYVSVHFQHPQPVPQLTTLAPSSRERVAAAAAAPI